MRESTLTGAPGAGAEEVAVDPTVDDGFAAYYRLHYAAVLRFAERRVDDPESAADVAAEVFRIAWTRRGDGPHPEAWLYRTARNVIGNEYRRRARARALEERMTEVRAPQAALGGDDDRAVVLAALDRLPERHREILRLAYWDDLDGETIAGVLGCSVPAVWTRLSRARRAFATAYRKEQS